MKVLLVFVVSADGKITKWGDPNVKSWSSQEDQHYFTRLISSAPLVVLGSNTWRADPIKAKDNRMMIVLTRDPDRYKEFEVTGKLEFSAESPSHLVKKYRKMGYEQMLVAGGPQVATSFLKEKLIDEIWLTVEPVIFGTGGCFVTENPLDIQLKLLSAERWNARGTMLLKYTIE